MITLFFRYGRKALIGSIALADGSLLAFGTFHLESYEVEKKERKVQLELLSQLTVGNGFSRIILCGDTNFAFTDEDQHLGMNIFGDCWKDLYPDQQGNTYGFRRLDRLYYSKKSIAPVSMRIIGTEPLPSTNVNPSDHFGIAAVVKVKEEPDSGA